MKRILLIFILSPLLLAAQKFPKPLESDSINIRYEARYRSTSTTFANQPIEEGFNQIYSTEDGLIISEGFYKKQFRFSLKALFTKWPLVQTFRIGLWTFYFEDKIYGQVAYDKRGQKIGEVYFYQNGNIREIRYRESAKKPWIIKRVYSESGELLDEEGEWNEHGQDNTK